MCAAASASPLKSSMTTTGLPLVPNRRSSGFTRLPNNKEEDASALPRSGTLTSELVLQADLELALVIGNLAILGKRRRFARAGTPGRIGAIQPIEDVEGGEVDGRFVTPRHLEGLGDAHVEPPVADVGLREESAAEVRKAARAFRHRAGQ